jgi:hypothetical protein
MDLVVFAMVDIVGRTAMGWADEVLESEDGERFGLEGWHPILLDDVPGARVEILWG